MNIETRSKKNLVSLRGYTPSENMKSQEEELCFGIYRNPESSCDPHEIHIMSLSLKLIFRDVEQVVRYQDIEEVGVPDKSSENDDLVIKHKDGSSTRITIAGRNGRFRDVYGFAQFLRGASRSTTPSIS